jgi:hypothetical protein
VLDPDLFEELALRPERNAPAVNLALAQEGNPKVLLFLARSAAVDAATLETIARRVEQEREQLAARDEDDEAFSTLDTELDSLVVQHPHATDTLRDAVLLRHPRDAFYVLAAASHPRATPTAIEAAVLWPSRFAVCDRSWLGLIIPSRLAPLTAAEWAQSGDPRRREAVAWLSRDPALLGPLVHDDRREVRRALAGNPAADVFRPTLKADPAADVRQRARIAAHERSEGPASLNSARFAAAIRSMEQHGVLKADVLEALPQCDDEEGRRLATRVLPQDLVLSLIQAHAQNPAAQDCFACGLAFRSSADKVDASDESFRELVAELTKTLAQLPEPESAHLTGKARLADWLARGVASATISATELGSELARGGLASQPMVFGRCLLVRPPILEQLCHLEQSTIAPVLLERAWVQPKVDDDRILELAARLGRVKRRGKDLSEDELDLDPTARSVSLLEKVVLSTSRKTIASVRSALSVIALDSRRVRYILTAMPQWKGELSGAMLSRVMRQRAGALSAGRSEHRPRGAAVRGWTERMLNDIELAIAFAIGHMNTEALLARLNSNRQRVLDGAGLAHAAEARAVVQGAESIAPLMRWAREQRNNRLEAFAIWLLLEQHDRPRSRGMIASAVDGIMRNPKVQTQPIARILSICERRHPGRLDLLVAQTPRGKGTIATAIARAYRAVGGLRDER